MDWPIPRVAPFVDSSCWFGRSFRVQAIHDPHKPHRRLGRHPEAVEPSNLRCRLRLHHAHGHKNKGVLGGFPHNLPTLVLVLYLQWRSTPQRRIAPPMAPCAALHLRRMHGYSRALMVGGRPEDHSYFGLASMQITQLRWSTPARWCSSQCVEPTLAYLPPAPVQGPYSAQIHHS
jgi:hypothetical protein